MQKVSVQQVKEKQKTKKRKKKWEAYKKEECTIN
jgi:hypothetical protein